MAGLQAERALMSSPKVPESMRKHLAERAREYSQQLRGSVAEKYLLSERGLTPEAIDHFQLGFVDTAMKNDAGHKGRLVVPYHTRTGVVALRSISIPDSTGSRPEPKVLPWMTGDTTRPYNVTSLDTADEVYIVEGESCAWTAWMLGLYVIGIPGVTNWKDVYRPLFRYRKVTILADMDDHGQGMEFAKTVASKLGGCSILPAERGHDLNSMWTTYGESFCRKHLGLDEDADL